MLERQEPVVIVVVGGHTQGGTLGSAEVHPRLYRFSSSFHIEMVRI